ncbi:biotin-[acetyl-CoA-carboxylase] ligase [Cryptococcus amylolentus CBS 6039]|uniref:Biotin-[acetyl-CoA-carboxylase] ligase n=2 Tax=Cryptococcus amylolentus TaxID=104669 RepID=A0A1E3HK25_9TREE|nr:biotin-[acetyl-CoA-carboxylase] ligase [Cryptococcus amylolentus CBS 6039]ODN76679.1 biotin-[acetyl-CoA-carboxylase] ligase [Cryptococcus amylolentus CBS 6039]ODO04640.1 biotin-[acetyl-CoA-carboxylase] ligase [Cryptococcus amylolentus CBS 6273]
MPGPAPSAHQVLVYSGPGVSPLSLSHTLLTLRLILLPHYTVQPVTPDILYSQPWEPSCALLVIPGGRDLPFVEALTEQRAVTEKIREYVQEGGRYLGLCAGAYFACEQVTFDVGGGLEVCGKRDLGFFPGPCVGPVFEGFEYASEAGSRALTLNLATGSREVHHIYYNGGGHFALSSPAPANVEVLARFSYPASSPVSEQRIAVVLTKNGKGLTLLASVHPEYPLSDPPASNAIEKLDVHLTKEELEVSDKARVAWFTELLVSVGLKPPAHESIPGGQTDIEEDPALLFHPTHPSPIFLLSHPSLPQLPSTAVNKTELKSKMVQVDGWSFLRDANDEVRFGEVEATCEDAEASEESVAKWLGTARRTKPVFEPALDKLSLDEESDVPRPPSPPDLHSLLKTVLLASPSIPYSPRWTPLFNLSTYWTELDQARKRLGRRSGIMRPGRDGLDERCSLGDCVLYGETVTSTQTMLDANPLLLSNLPAPLAFLASFQLSGRGRGGNMWLSPPGCLQFSILLDLPQELSSKMVFIQYMMALAVAEAVDEDGRLGVRIKWPNDIYAEVEGVGGSEVGSGKKGKAKLGGILVNTSYVGGRWRVVVGCGINVLNALPTTSLSQLHSLQAAKLSSSNKPLPPAPTMEGTFARIMSSFDAKWEQFIEEKGFKGFMDEYHGRWLHAGQEVTLTTTEPHTRVRILQITPDHGLLRCIPLSNPRPQASHGLTPLYDRNVDEGENDRGGWSSKQTSGAGSNGSSPYVDLQPDGNSFDLMSGLIRRKA